MNPSAILDMVFKIMIALINGTLCLLDSTYYTCTTLCTCMYACMCVCTCVYVHVCMYMYVHVCTCTCMYVLQAGVCEE